MRKSTRAGGALLMAMVAFVLMAGIGGALFSMAMTSGETSRAAANADTAFHLAEAGIDDAIGRMRAYAANPDGATGELAALDAAVRDESGTLVNRMSGKMRGGTYVVTITPPYDGAGEYRVRSIGTWEGERRAIESFVLSEEEETGFPFGLFGDEGVTASGNVFADSYKSSLGSYASQALNSDPASKKKYAKKGGNIGSNKGITVSGNVSVFGDVTPGPKDTLSKSGSVSISGSSAPAKTATVLEKVTYAPVGATKGDLSLSGKTTLTLNGGSHRYTTISASAQTAIVVKQNVTLYVDKDLSISGQAKIQIEPGATLTLHHGTGSISLSGGGLVNSSQLPKNFNVRSASTGSVSISGNSAFYGHVYAPGAEIKPSGTTDLFGSFVGKKVTISGGAVFHYDEDAGGSSSSILSLSVKGFRPYVP